MPGTQEILTVNHLSLGVTLALFFSASLLLQPRDVFGSPAFSGMLGSGVGAGGCTWSCCAAVSPGWTRSLRCWSSPCETLCSGAVYPPRTAACLRRPGRLPTWAEGGGEDGIVSSTLVTVGRQRERLIDFMAYLSGREERLHFWREVIFCVVEILQRGKTRR